MEKTVFEENFAKNVTFSVELVEPGSFNPMWARFY